MQLTEKMYSYFPALNLDICAYLAMMNQSLFPQLCFSPFQRSQMCAQHFMPTQEAFKHKQAFNNQEALEKPIIPSKDQIQKKTALQMLDGQNNFLNAEIKREQVIEQFQVQCVKKNKNTNSNILRYFMIYLKDQYRMKQKCQQILSITGYKNCPFEQVNELIQKYVKPKQHYCNPGYFYKLFHGHSCPIQFAKFLRVTFKIFIKHDFALFLKKSPRIKRSSKLLYLHHSRILFKQLMIENNRKFLNGRIQD